MGTKLQSAIDLLAKKEIFVAAEIKDSMERAFEQRSLEAVKKTMLKQEEVFKQQVKELHRLYSVQRMLMKELKNEINLQSKYSKAPTTINQGSTGLGYSLQLQNERDQHTWEQSGSCSGGETKARVNAKGSCGIDFAITRPADHQEDNFTGVSIAAIEAATAGPGSSCSVVMPGSSRITGVSRAGLEQDLSGVDLTLSLGGGSKKRLKEYQSYQCIGLGCSDATKSDQKSQEQQRPSLGTMRSSAGIPKITLNQGEGKRTHWSF